MCCGQVWCPHHGIEFSPLAPPEPFSPRRTLLMILAEESAASTAGFDPSSSLPDWTIVTSGLAEEERGRLRQLCTALLEAPSVGPSAAPPDTTTDDDDAKPSSSQWCAHTLIRFLRARPTVAESAAMYRAHVEWRAAFGTDAVAAAWPKDDAPTTRLLRKHWFAGYHGRDNWGLPVHVVKVGRSDPSGIARECGVAGFLNQHVSDLENMYVEARRVSAARHEFCGSFVEIFDCGGFGYSRAMRAISPFKAITAVLEANYPERVRCVYVVRAPKLFEAIWKVAKKFIPKDTAAKVRKSR